MNDKRISLAILAGLLVFSICFFLTNFLSIEEPWLSQFTLKLLLVFLSFLMAYLLHIKRTELFGKGGFNWKETKRFVWYGLSLGAFLTILILTFKLPPIPLMTKLSFGQIILVVWLWSSVAEEIFARGLVQSIVNTNDTTKLIGDVPVRVVASALVFSLIHISIFIGGGTLLTSLIVMLFTLILGLFAGIAKERGNLVSSIVVHVAFNVGGVIGGIVANIIPFIGSAI